MAAKGSGNEFLLIAFRINFVLKHAPLFDDNRLLGAALTIWADKTSTSCLVHVPEEEPVASLLF